MLPLPNVVVPVRGNRTASRLVSLSAVCPRSAHHPFCSNMADAFTDEQIQEFYEAFCLIDKDSDGFITMEELTRVMRSMGKNPKREELEEMIKEIDVYGTGGVNFEDFLFIIAHNTKETSGGDELSEVFRVFDRDGDGFISAIELGQGMKEMGMKITEEEAEQMVREADLDGNGFLSFDEFSKMMIAASF